MKKNILIWIALFLVLPALAAVRPAKDLAALLQTYLEQQRVHPDSIYPNILKMEQRCQTCTDPTERAVTEAVLGCLYAENRPWAQARRNKTTFNPANMDEWSAADFDSAATAHFTRALSDLDLLHRARIRDWAPMLSEGKDDALFDDDLLMPLYNEARNRVFSAEKLPSYARLIQFYKEKNNRRAALWLSLDSVGFDWQHRQVTLEKLRDEYSDLDLCAEVYLKLSSGADQDSIRYAWAQEGLRRYPKYNRRARLENQLLGFSSPVFNLRLHREQVYPYPGQPLRFVLSARNLTGIRCSLYRVPSDYEHNAEEKTLERQGTLVRNWQQALTTHPVWETWQDTLQFTAPDNGHYILRIAPQTQAKAEGKVQPCDMEFRVSRLCLSQFKLPGNVYRQIVTDGMSGQPQSGVTVIVSQLSNDDQETVVSSRKFVTDARGIVDCPCDVTRLYKVHVERPGDVDYIDDQWRTTKDYRATDEQVRLRLFTDRSVYRPGQTVHVSGIINSQKHWQMNVLADRDVVITLRDAEYKEVARDTLRTDDMGTFAHDFVLPTSGKLGRYVVEANHVACSIQVEEYRRPTFEVAMDEVPALQLPADSITLTGVARSYAGVPLRHVRVTNSMAWDFPLWGIWVRHLELPDAVDLDTVWTDDEGRFSVRIPITLTENQWRWGRRLTLTSTVTNDAGESHEGRQSVCLSSASLHMSTDLAELEDKDDLTPWTVKLYSVTGKEVAGTVDITLRQGTQTALHLQKPSGQVQMEELKGIPSGAYNLLLMGIAGKDTVREERRVVIFSQHDTRLPVDTTFWYYPIKTKFSETEPVRIQVGSSVRDASLYYLLLTNNQVVRDTLIQFSDSLMMLEIPYEKRFGDGAQLCLYMVRDGVVYGLHPTLQLATPDKRLQHRWVTFRDRLQPGQQETWTLQVNRPDGTPASANLMVAMYDASLDPLRHHRWAYSPTFSHQIFNTRFSTVRFPQMWADWSFPIRMKRSREYIFSTLDDNLFRSRSVELYGHIGQHDNVLYETVATGGRMYKSAAMNSRVTMAAAPQGAAYEMAEDEAILSESEMNGLTVDQTTKEPEIAVPLRENFAETAFFYPQLRTDSEGKVNITFTLPESLTTWHLWALTHTQDVCAEVFDEKVIAQKDLMAQLLLPRFLRPGDEAYLTATVTNISDQAQTGQAMLRLVDAETEKVILSQKVSIDIPAHRDTVFQFPWTATAQHDRIVVRWMVEGKTCSDGEQRLLPILPAEEWITNTRAITGYGIGESQVDLTGIFPETSTHRQLTIEYTTHPEQLALEALPALTKTERKDALSLAAAYYATRLAQHLGVQVPDSSDAYLQRLAQMQHANGALSWYPCDQSVGNAYITREVCFLLTRLQTLTGSTGADPLYQKALDYLMNENHKQIADWKKRDYEPTYLYNSQLRNLYVILFSGRQLTKSQQQDVDYLLRLLRQSTDEYDIEDQALSAIILQQVGENRKARKCVDKFRSLLVTTADRGTYIEWRKGSFVSIDRKVDIHVQMMEALERVTPDSTRLLSNMRRYLLQQKRTQQWDTPVHSASAIFALCQGPSTDAAPARDVLTLQNRRGRTLANFIPADDTLGYVRDSIRYTRITTAVDEPAKLRLMKFSQGESWGAVYADFRQPISQVESASEGLSLRVEFPSNAASGSRIVARYVITADRDYEFVDLSVPRPAALEPVRQLSGYRWQNGLGYYQEMRDNRTDYHMEAVPRGTYVIEEEFFVERQGRYSAGIPTLRCTYAEEFQSHCPNQVVNVK